MYTAIKCSYWQKKRQRFFIPRSQQMTRLVVQHTLEAHPSWCRIPAVESTVRYHHFSADKRIPIGIYDTAGHRSQKQIYSNGEYCEATTYGLSASTTTRSLKRRAHCRATSTCVVITTARGASGMLWSARGHQRRRAKQMLSSLPRMSPSAQ